jgi:hypothetical protein
MEDPDLLVPRELDETCGPGQRVFWQNFKGTETYFGTVVNWHHGYWCNVRVDSSHPDYNKLGPEKIIEFEF